jgi:uncharacterized protein YjbI with pentapeptide repeats
MANVEHISVLKQGPWVWNRWRKDNPGIRPDLPKAFLPGAYLTGANLAAAHLQKADLRWAILGGVNLTDAILTEANLTSADLYKATLTKADLTGASLYGANLHGTNLQGTNLYRVDLYGADLTGANLTGANLTGTDLTGADLTGANLTGADLNGANLTGANLLGADLSAVNLNKCTLGWNVISDVDLSKVKALQSIIHAGPSFVGLDTIYKSQGKIPEIFLRGVGVPDNLIEFLPHLIGDAIQFYSCFISYSSADQEFAERLHADLQGKGVRCWFAPENIKGGRKLHAQIPEAIRLYDKLLLVLSENSMESEWVKTEIYHARQDEIRTGKRKLFPLGLIQFKEIRKWEAFDADVGKDMAREVREYYIPDFSDWKNHISYKKALNRLLGDLEAGD